MPELYFLVLNMKIQNILLEEEIMQEALCDTVGEHTVENTPHY